MALFDLNSRYTKSMEHGGSYEREASIGGYNRKELRGLNRQARRGSLTQRERARLKYLTDERRGRRKRGLLSGLGGAAATLGALAAAGKLGEGEGGGGAALMDAIKLRLAEGKDKAKDKLELLNDKRLAKKLGVDPREYVDDSPSTAVTEDVSSNMQLPPELRDTPEEPPSIDRVTGADLVSRFTNTGADVDDVLEKIEQDVARTQARDRSIAAGESAQRPVNPYAPLEEGMSDAAAVRQGRSDAAINNDLLGMLDMENELKREEEEELSRAIKDMNKRYKAQERSKAQDDASRVSSKNPLPTGITSTRRNTGPEVTGLKSRSVDLGSDFPAELPARTNIRPIESSNNQPPAVDPNDAITRIFQRTGSRAVRANSVDPMGLLGGDSRDENVSEAQREEDAVEFLSLLNRKRVEKGLPEVNKITMDAIKETGRSTSELMNSRQFGQIPTNRSKKNLPQLEALQQLRSILGNRYR